MNAMRDIDQELDEARAERDAEREAAIANDRSNVIGFRRDDARLEQLRVPPHSVESEQAVLGGLMLAPEAYDRIAGKVAEADFYRRDHRLIFRAIGELAAKGKPFDAVTLGDWFVDNGQAELVAGGAYLVELASTTPSAANIVAYAEIVRDKSRMRKLIEVGTQIVNDGFQNEGRDSAALLAEAEQALLGIEVGTAGAYKPKRLQFLPTGDFLRNIAAPNWTIRGIAERDTVTMLFGDPASGKSFMAIDWACCVATGTEWNGRKVQPGPVLYINGEGHNGIGRRLRAWAIRHHIPLQKHPLFLSSVTTSLTDSAARAELLNVITAFCEQHGQPAMIVIDTLARNFGSGDENNTQDMTQAVASIDAVRLATRASVVVVHHSGHGDKTRARGSIVMLGALDNEYCLTRLADPETSEPLEETLLECTKIKDGNKALPVSFRFADVGLGVMDEEGEEVTSAVLDASHNPNPVKAWAVKDKAAKGGGKMGRPTKNHDQALGILRGLYAEARRAAVAAGRPAASALVSFKDWRAAMIFDGIHRSQTYRIPDALIADGTLIRDGYYVRFADSEEEKP